MSGDPTPIHHVIKYGLNSESAMPTIIGDLYFLLFVLVVIFGFSASLSVSIAKSIRKSPPVIPNVVFIHWFVKSVLMPYAISSTSGNSTSVCPIAMFIPAFQLFFAPRAIDDTVRGPGARAPEALMIMTLIAKLKSMGLKQFT